VLLSVGLPPITANVSNTVGLFPGSFVGAYGYRRELSGQRHRALVLLTATVLGSTVGAILLLVLPAGAFKAVVPALIVLAIVLVVFGPRMNKALAARGRGAGEAVRWPLWLAILGTGVYGGYFGAAQGVLTMAFFGLMLKESIQRQNALKNILAGTVNLVAAIVFIASSHIDWAAAGLIAVGSIVGGLLGARIGRKLSPKVLRALIVVVGVLAILKLVL
jgi:uncharacterized membrane protein YfcA